MNVNPPDVPTPGMEGGEKAATCASGIFEKIAFRRAWMAATCRPAFFRSPHGVSVTKKKALYVAWTWLSKLKPSTVV